MIDEPGTSTPSRGGRALIAALAVASAGSGLYLPLALVYFLALTDVPLAILGVLLGVASAVSLPVPTLAGVLVDRVGARPIVLTSLILQAASFLALVWVTEPLGIFLALTLGAVGNRLYWSSIFALITDYAEGAAGTARTDDWFAWANIARTVGIGLGGLVTGLVVADGTDAAYRGVAVASAVCFTLSATGIALIVRVPRGRHTEHAPQASTRTMLRDGRFLALTGINTVFALSTLMLGIALPTFILLGLEGPPWLTSTLLVGNATLVLLLGALIVRLVAPLRRTRVLMLAGLGWAAWAGGFALIANGAGPVVWVILIASTLIFTVSELLHAPTSMALVAAVAPPATRGRYLATFQYSWVIAEVIAPVLFATLFAASHALPFLVLAGLNVAAIGLTLLLERRLPTRSLRA